MAENEHLPLTEEDLVPELDPRIVTAAQRAADAVMEQVRIAADAAVKDVLARIAGGLISLSEEPAYTERVTQAEAAKQLDVTPQRIMRLIRKDLIWSTREGGNVYVNLSEVRMALGIGSEE